MCAGDEILTYISLLRTVEILHGSQVQIIVCCRRWGSNPYSFETDLNSVTFANSVTPAYSEYDTLHADFEKLVIGINLYLRGISPHLTLGWLL